MVKIKKFLDYIAYKLLNETDFHYRTISNITQFFKECLSPTEIGKYSNKISLILSITTKQSTIDDFIQKKITDDLETDLNNHKKDIINLYKSK